MLSFLLSACGSGTIDMPASTAPAPPEPRPATAVSLDLGDVTATFEIAPSSRPEGVGDAIPLVGPFARATSESERSEAWIVPLPVKADLMPTKTKGTHTFGSAPPPGLSVHGPHGELTFDRRGRKAGTYWFDRDHLYVLTAIGEPPPKVSDYRVVFERAAKAERELNLDESGLSVDAFVHRNLAVDGTSHRGLLLPAPSTGTFRLHVPKAGMLSFRHLVLSPAVTVEKHSDGASIAVTVRAGGEERKVATFEARLGDPVHAKVDLSAWAGQDVELVIATDPGADPALDYVFLEDPVVYTPSTHPRRAMLIFVDTTRPDHLGFMGYERDTTPVLDRWSAHAAVFEDARSVAPWTLPSARAVLTGDEPERWYATEKVAESFARAGWRTEAIVSNAFLSQPFDVQVGWGRFRFEHLLHPPDIVEAGRAALAEEPDRDTLLMVHFMGPHLPWEEPLTQRWRWAGSRPEGLKADGRVAIMQVQHYDPAFAEISDYVVARYDQNIRWTDGELQALLEAGGPDATVVFFSDHGEELWDH
ncbi:MAG: sulfatase-like hydrolase/transferase, partial [Myxococcales bacterium]|nr:sulfatase-like hydrolase/transferase [Myxococcales bacterium]